VNNSKNEMIEKRQLCSLAHPLLYSLTAVNEYSGGWRYLVMALTGTTHREVYMRVAVFGFLSGFALAALPLAANAVPMGPSVPAVDSASAVELVAGGCGPGWHPVPGHFTPWGRWIPWHCRPNHYWWP
jgi:hypothetical protein